MQGATTITIQGNLVDDPELRYTPSGAPVAKFRIASTPRVYDKQTNEWKDGDSLFLTCTVWRKVAENVAESLAKGTAVIVVGQLKQRSYEDREGVKRTVYEIDVENVGPSLRTASAVVTKNGRGGSGQAAQGGGWGQPQQGGWGGSQPAGSAPAGDPWATNAPAAAGQADSGYSGQPPF